MQFESRAILKMNTKTNFIEVSYTLSTLVNHENPIYHKLEIKIPITWKTFFKHYVCLYISCKLAVNR